MDKIAHDLVVQAPYVLFLLNFICVCLSLVDTHTHLKATLWGSLAKLVFLAALDEHTYFWP